MKTETRTTCEENSEGCLMLFGVNILAKNNPTSVDDTVNKCLGMVDLSYCHEEKENECSEAGYLLDDLNEDKSQHDFHDRRNKGKPWTEEEHRDFLSGLKHLGKGNWKEISRNYVTSKTPTQVASHAQKYFLRMGAYETRKRRRSLFDMPLIIIHLHESNSGSQIIILRNENILQIKILDNIVTQLAGDSHDAPTNGTFLQLRVHLQRPQGILEKQDKTKQINIRPDTLLDLSFKSRKNHLCVYIFIRSFFNFLLIL